ncbi:hypothetical protein AAMO2058_001247200 [Amorphochlora amoebiformis]
MPEWMKRPKTNWSEVHRIKREKKIKKKIEVLNGSWIDPDPYIGYSKGGIKIPKKVDEDLEEKAWKQLLYECQASRPAGAVGKAGLTESFLNAIKIQIMKSGKNYAKFRFGAGFRRKRPRQPEPSTMDIMQWIERDPALAMLYRHGSYVGIYVRDIRKMVINLPGKRKNKTKTHLSVMRYYNGGWHKQDIYPTSWFYEGLVEDNHGKGDGFRKIRMSLAPLRLGNGPFHPDEESRDSEIDENESQELRLSNAESRNSGLMRNDSGIVGPESPDSGKVGSESRDLGIEDGGFQDSRVSETLGDRSEGFQTVFRRYNQSVAFLTRNEIEVTESDSGSWEEEDGLTYRRNKATGEVESVSHSARIPEIPDIQETSPTRKTPKNDQRLRNSRKSPEKDHLKVRKYADIYMHAFGLYFPQIEWHPDHWGDEGVFLEHPTSI